MTTIEKYGYKGEERAGVARVIRSHGDYYHLVCNETDDIVIARKKKSNFLNSVLLPMTGDFVEFRYNSQGESMVTKVLPRFSSFERRDPSARRQSQTLAVNFDTLFIMTGLDSDFSKPRIARYLTLAEDVGSAEVVVVLTKSDIATEEVDLSDLGGKVLKISSLTGQGMDAIRQYAAPGKTIAMVGSSGVGKSTLLNALAGSYLAETCETQSWSGKGRHTTTTRSLEMLPNGAMVVDTPGIREIGQVGEIDVRLDKTECSHRYRVK